jgi:hypothetical protein
MRVAMPLVYRRISTQAIQVAFPVHISDPAAFALVEDNIQGFVISRAVFIFELDIVLRVHVGYLPNSV